MLVSLWVGYVWCSGSKCAVYWLSSTGISSLELHQTSYVLLYLSPAVKYSCQIQLGVLGDQPGHVHSWTSQFNYCWVGILYGGPACHGWCPLTPLQRFLVNYEYPRFRLERVCAPYLQRRTSSGSHLSAKGFCSDSQKAIAMEKPKLKNSHPFSFSPAFAWVISTLNL